MAQLAANVANILRILNRTYPDPKPFLNFRTAFESLVATILSAQCTDARVNLVTKELFRVANTPRKILGLGKRKLISYIRPTGFFNAKASNILRTSQKIIDDFDGEVPHTLDDLQKLPGVGRKTASVVMCQAFGVPAFPVDRHVLRVANRLRLARSKNPDDADLQLRKRIPRDAWIPTHLQLIMHGRMICRPKPRCNECPLLPHCPYGQDLQRNKKSV